MLVGGGERGVRVWVAFCRGGESENCVFHAEEHIYNL